jgi:hypothetical protein
MHFGGACASLELLPIQNLIIRPGLSDGWREGWHVSQKRVKRHLSEKGPIGFERKIEKREKFYGIAG